MCEEIGFIEIDEVSEFNTCRCCLSEQYTMDNISECFFEDVSILEILNVVAPVSILIDDGFHQTICEICKTNAINAYSFRQTCIASDEKIRSEPTSSQINYKMETTENLESSSEPIEILEEVYSTDDESDEFDCTFCGHTFETSEELSKHVLGNHRSEVEKSLDEEFECWICQKLFKSQAILDVHVKSHENKVTKSSSRKYGCDICQKHFETPSKLTRHMTVHRDILDPEDLPPPRVKEFRYVCMVCSKPVETPSKLERHMRVHNKSEKLYTGINQHRPHPCPECDTRFWDAVKLERHQVLHSEDFKDSKINHPPGHMFTCVICLTQINDYDDCMDHIKSHREDLVENTPIECKLCGKIYPKISSVVRHARSHPENATHKCVHCDKKLGLGDDLIDHMLRHQGFKPFECKICGKKFMKSHKLKQHLVLHEDNAVNPFQCEICDKSFAGAEYLKRHLLRHSGQKNHVCTICSAKFTFRNGLTVHMETHAVKTLACEICGTTFNKKQTLKVHMMTHTGEKKFPCSQCDMAFTVSSHLKRHMLTHSGVRPYSCKYCTKSYTQSNDLIKHLKTHLGPNVYRCDIDGCQEAFEKFNELKKHKTLHYNSDLIAEEEIYLEDEDGNKFQMETI